MKVLKKKILLSLTLPVDFLNQREGFRYLSYNYIYFLVKFKLGSIRSAISQLVRSGEVDKISRNNVAYFRLTGAGRPRLMSFFPISSQNMAWDGYWRLVIKNEGPLPTLKLTTWGFKKIVRGVYLSPRYSPLLENYFLAKNLLGKVIFIEKSRFLAPESLKIAQKLWHLDALEREYRDFVSLCRQLLKKLNYENRLKNQDKITVVELFETYFSLLSKDPGLPKKLLSTDWPGDYARKIFLSIFDRIENKKMLDIF